MPAGLFSTENPLAEFLDRLSSKGRGTGALRLAEGSSLLVRVLNPLLTTLFQDTDPRTDFVTKPPETPNNLQTQWMARVLQAAASGPTGKAGAAMDKFAFDATKAAMGKTTAMQLPKDQDPRKLAKEVSKKFAAVTGIDLQQ